MTRSKTNEEGERHRVWLSRTSRRNSLQVTNLELCCVGAGLPEPFVGQVERFQVEAEEGGFHREVPTPEYVWLMLRGH